MIDGILPINKPIGMSSHDLINRIRRIANLRKVGHAGTLDPLATGLMLVALGSSTRLIEYIVGLPKRYQTTIRLGQTTDTYDAEGTILTDQPVTVSLETIDETLLRFKGDLQQIPPMYSAIKKNGQPLYKLARQGIEIERPPRSVTIDELNLLSWNLPLLELSVACSSGTYIRSLAYDIGATLGCGAHIATLHRTAIGTFQAEQTISLDQLTSDNIHQYLLPPETAVIHLPKIILSDQDALDLYHGKRPHRETTTPIPLVRAYTANDDFVGILIGHNDRWQARKIFYSPPDIS